MGIIREAITDEQQNKVYHRLHYVRYADDYLIAIKGPKWIAKKVQEKTKSFLQSNLHFRLKDGELIHSVNNKVNFLGFDIKVPSRKERDVVETRKILSFKKIRNRLVNRKNNMEGRFEKAILESYMAEKTKYLKALLNKNKDKALKVETIKQVALQDASQLKNLVELKGNKWYTGDKPFEK